MFIFKLEILYLIGPDHFLTYVVKILYMLSFFFIFSYIKINFQFFYILIFIIKFYYLNILIILLHFYYYIIKIYI